MRLRPNPSAALAGLALFVALGGGAYAASGDITGRDIANNSVGGKDIRQNSVAGGDIRDDSLKGADIDESTLELQAGSAGSPGQTGERGPQGDRGLPGPKGDQGPRGDPGVMTVRERPAASDVPANGTNTAIALCNPGEILLGGGFSVSGGPDPGDAQVFRSERSDADANRWVVQANNLDPVKPFVLIAVAECGQP